MTYLGHVQNGMIVLDDPAAVLPEGTKVRVEPASEVSIDKQADHGSLYDRMKDLVGIIDSLPPDFSENHDHYLYGVDKRTP